MNNLIVKVDQIYNNDNDRENIYILGGSHKDEHYCTPEPIIHKSTLFSSFFYLICN